MAIGSAARNPHMKRIARMTANGWRSTRPRSAGRPAGDHMLAITAAKPEKKLVAHQRTEPGDGNDHGEIEKAGMRRIAGKQQHRFAFEHFAQKHWRDSRIV